MAIGALRLLSTLWRALCGLRLLLLALEARHNVVNAQNHDGRLDGCLDCLNLDGHWLPDAKVLHVRKHALVAINTPRDVACRRMLCPECGESANDVCTTVLDESAGDNLECRSHGLVGPLPNALDALGLFEEQLRQRHLSCAATGNEARVHQHIARDVHGILQVAFNLHEDVLARTTEENRACLGILALSDEGKVLITNLLHLEKARASANVRLLQLVRAVHNRRTARPANAVVVRLAHSPQSSDVMLHKVVLCKVGNTLLRDDKVGLECDDVVAHLLNKFLFELQNVLPVAFLCHLEVRLALALLILQGAIQQHDARVFNAATHLSVRHILVDHHTSKHLRLLNLTAGNLLNLGVALNVDFAAPILLNGDGAHGRKCDLAGEVGPPLHELGTETRLDNVEHSRVVIRVDGRADVLFNEGGCIIQSLGVRTDNDGGVHLGSRKGSATVSISPARMITDVVPSPTSSSCVLLISIIDFAAGCDTSISRKMAFPSFVMTMPPIGSMSILSMARGPRQVRMTSATARADAMLLSWTLRPLSRLTVWLRTMTGCCIFATGVCSRVGEKMYRG
eukprot:Opistho-2@80698